MGTLKRIRSDESFDAFYGSISKKKKAFNGNIGGPNWKRNTQAPTRFSVERALDDYPTTLGDN